MVPQVSHRTLVLDSAANVRCSVELTEIKRTTNMACICRHAHCMRELTINSDEFNAYSDYAEDTMVLDVLPSVSKTQCSSLVALNITAPAGEFAEGSQLHVLTSLTSLTSLTCLEVCTKTPAVTRSCFAAGSDVCVSWHCNHRSRGRVLGLLFVLPRMHI